MEKRPTPQHSTGDHYRSRPCSQCRHVGHQGPLATECWHQVTVTMIGRPQFGCAHWQQAEPPPMAGTEDRADRG